MANPVVHFEIGAADDQSLLEVLRGAVRVGAAGGVPEVDYTLVDTRGGGGINGGIGRSGTGEPWATFYVEVDDPQASLDRAGALGGRHRAAGHRAARDGDLRDVRRPRRAAGRAGAGRRAARAGGPAAVGRGRGGGGLVRGAGGRRRAVAGVLRRAVRLDRARGRLRAGRARRPAAGIGGGIGAGGDRRAGRRCTPASATSRPPWPGPRRSGRPASTGPSRSGEQTRTGAFRDPAGNVFGVYHRGPSLTDPAFYRSRSLWLDQLGDDPLVPRPPLPGPGRRRRGDRRGRLHRALDRLLPAARRPGAAGGGAGAGGRRVRGLGPQRRLVLVVRGHGPGAAWPAEVGRGAAIALQREMFDTVDEVGRVAGREGIDCHYVKAGALEVATSPVQLARLEAGIRARPPAGAWAPTTCGCSAGPRPSGGSGWPGCSTPPSPPTAPPSHPARLARGLAEVVERLGTPIYESTEATRIRPGRVDTARGARSRPRWSSGPPRATARPSPACAGRCSRCTR